MRITGGLGGGLPLTAPPGGKTRPATDRMREAVFSSLGARMVGAQVLDLYAGSGAYGLEALSRGADGACFVERDKRAVRALQHNLARLAKAFAAQQQSIPETQVVADDVGRFLRRAAGFDLVFCDPPYDRAETAALEVLRALSTGEGRLTLVLEVPGELEFDAAGWRLRKRLGKRLRDAPSVAIFERESHR